MTLERREDPVSLTEIEIDDPLTSEILWNSAPQVRERFVTLTPVSAVQPLVTAYEDGEWILWQARPTISSSTPSWKMTPPTRRSRSGLISTT